MEAFRAGRIQVLISTTVIEVGVDAPNATLLAIEGGQLFGLSQSHQLAGRICRGTYPGFCCVRRRLEGSAAPAGSVCRLDGRLSAGRPGFRIPRPWRSCCHARARLAAAADRGSRRDAEVLAERVAMRGRRFWTIRTWPEPSTNVYAEWCFMRDGRVLELGDEGSPPG